MLDCSDHRSLADVGTLSPGQYESTHRASVVSQDESLARRPGLVEGMFLRVQKQAAAHAGLYILIPNPIKAVAYPE